MKSFEIEKNDESQRLDKFIHKAAPLLPQSLDGGCRPNRPPPPDFFSL